MRKNIQKIKSLTEMEKFAEEFQKEYLRSVKNEGATVIALSGDLGSGKTTFVRSLARVFGVTSRVTSPTFVIEKRYDILKEDIPFEKLIHIDAYRLEGESADVLDLKKTLSHSSNLVCIEWPEYIGYDFLQPEIFLQFTFLDENTREIKLQIMEG